jgi:hypothetical protein
MDDWSKVPSRQAVSEPAPNHQSTLSKPSNDLPDSAYRVKRRHRRGSTLPATNRRLTRQASPDNRATSRGRSPKTPSTIVDSDDQTPPPTQPNIKTAKRYLTSTAPSWMTNVSPYQLKQAVGGI